LTFRLLLTFLLTCPTAGLSQTNAKDTAFVQTAILNAQAVYARAMNGQSNLNKGTEYPTYESLQPNEHAYFMSEDWIDGTINYGGEVYKNVSMQFDLFRDKIVVEHTLSHIAMELINENIKWFDLLGHRFVFVKSDDKKREGFYDLLYDGKVKALAKYEKSQQKNIKDKKVTYYFAERTHYYLFKEGNYYPVSSKNAALDVFSDKERELKQFLKKEKISFRRDRTAAMARMAAFYDQVSE
jgi:hypothetical protein